MPGRAVDLHRAVDDPPERLGDERLDHRDLLAVRQAVLDLPGRVQHHQPRRVEVHRAVGEHELQRLVAGELLAERLARQQPLRRRGRARAARRRSSASRAPGARPPAASARCTKPSPSAPSRLPRRHADVGRARSRGARRASASPSTPGGARSPSRACRWGRGSASSCGGRRPRRSPVLATTIANAAPSAPVMHHLRPLRTHSSPSRTAVVSRFVGSQEATSGSVIAKHERMRALGQRAQAALLLLVVAGDQQRVHVALVGRHRVEAERGQAATRRTPARSAPCRARRRPRPPYSSGRCGV